MNPQQSSDPGLGLPLPSEDMAQLPAIHPPQSFHAPDTALPQFADQPPAPAMPALQPAPINATPVTPVSAVPTSPVPALQADDKAIQADDIDTEFDEEWVAKAQETVARTHNDPFAQSVEISKLKAQYIKARYNKDIKVAE